MKNLIDHDHGVKYFQLIESRQFILSKVVAGCLQAYSVFKYMLMMFAKYKIWYTN